MVKRKGIKDEKWSKNTTQKTNDCATQTPRKTGIELTSSTTSDTCRVTLITNPVTSHQ